MCAFICVREGEEGGGGEQRERDKEASTHVCDGRWRPILPISGSGSLESLKSKEIGKLFGL